MLKRIIKKTVKIDMVLMTKMIEEEAVRDQDRKTIRVIMKIAKIKRDIIKDKWSILMILKVKKMGVTRMEVF